MAILQEEPQLQVYVECDGEFLPEYDADENDTTPTTITKYIEAKSGAEFAVQIELSRPFPQYAMVIKLSIDGRHISSHIIGDRHYARAKTILRRTFDYVTSEITDREYTMRKFCFSQLQIEDLNNHDLGAAFTRNLRSMGTIALEAHYIWHLREVPVQGGRVDRRPAQLGPIPEKALKGEALSHCTELGRAITVPYFNPSYAHSTHTIFDYVHPQRFPFATFNFKYRSRTALQSLLVIPRSPFLSPRPVKDDDALVGDIPKPKEEVPVTSVKDGSGLKREHSTAVAGGDNSSAMFLSAVQHQRPREESGLKRECPVDDDEVVFVSATKRRRANITVNENGVEFVDLT